MDEPVPVPTNNAIQQTHHDMEGLREKRIDDCFEQALSKPDPLLASLGAFNAGLMKMARRLEEQALSHASQSLERPERHYAAMEMYLKVLRQMDRFAQLEIRHNGTKSGEA